MRKKISDMRTLVKYAATAHSHKTVVTWLCTAVVRVILIVNVDCVNLFSALHFPEPEEILRNLINHELSPLVTVISLLIAL